MAHVTRLRPASRRRRRRRQRCDDEAIRNTQAIRALSRSFGRSVLCLPFGTFKYVQIKLFALNVCSLRRATRSEKMASNWRKFNNHHFAGSALNTSPTFALRPFYLRIHFSLIENKMHAVALSLLALMDFVHLCTGFMASLASHVRERARTPVLWHLLLPHLFSFLSFDRVISFDAKQCHSVEWKLAHLNLIDDNYVRKCCSMPESFFLPHTHWMRLRNCKKRVNKLYAMLQSCDSGRDSVIINQVVIYIYERAYV